MVLGKKLYFCLYKPYRMTKINANFRKFINEFLLHRDSTLAYIKAYPFVNKQAAKMAGERLLTHPLIIEHLANWDNIELPDLDTITLPDWSNIKLPDWDTIPVPDWSNIKLPDWDTISLPDWDNIQIEWDVNFVQTWGEVA